MKLNNITESGAFSWVSFTLNIHNSQYKILLNKASSILWIPKIYDVSTLMAVVPCDDAGREL